MSEVKMDKGRKLSLKRKTLGLDHTKVKKHVADDRNTSKHINNSDTDIVIIEDSEVNGHKTDSLKPPENNIASNSGNNLGCDSALLKLREMLFNISAREKHSVLTPFPPHVHIEDSSAMKKDRQSMTPEKGCSDKLSPFPKPCAHFISRKLRTRTPELPVSMLGNKDRDQECVNIKTNVNPVPLEENRLIMRDRNSNLYSMQAANMNIRESRVGVETVTDHISGKASKQVPSSVSETGINLLNKSEEQCINRPKPSLNIHKTDNIVVYNCGSENERKPKDIETEYPGTFKVTSSNYVNGNGLRNPNFHAVKIDTLNTNILDARGGSSASRNTTITDNDTSNNQLLKPVETSVNTDLGHRRTSSVIAGSSTYSNSTSNVSKPNTSANISITSESKASTSASYRATSVHENNRPEVQALHSPEAVFLDKCPLCQLEFAKGSNQMEKDSHIAMCLSNAGDDAAW